MKLDETACDAYQSKAVRTISSKEECRGFHPRSSLALAARATSSGGSPARRAASRRGTLQPLTRSTAATTSRTECPLPVPRFSAVLFSFLSKHRSRRQVLPPGPVRWSKLGSLLQSVWDSSCHQFTNWVILQQAPVTGSGRDADS